MNRFYCFFVLLSCYLLNACSVNTSASSRIKSNFNFAKVQSYSTFERNSLFSDYQNISDTTRNSIELAIEQVFDQLGLQYKQQIEADVIVGYHLITENFDELKAYNKGVKYCEVCLKWSHKDQVNHQWKLLPGSLILDVVEPQFNRSIWRSILPLKIKPKDNSKDMQIKIRAALELMLKNFPDTAGVTAFRSAHPDSVMPQLSVHN